MGCLGKGRAWHVLVFLLCLGVFTPFYGAAETDGPAQSKRVDEASRYTVKIHNSTANIFEPSPEGCTGSGFIVEADDEKVVIFTNNHVVEKTHFDAQSIEIDFPVAKGRPNRVAGRVVYRNPLIDFAVVECRRSEMRKGNPYWAVAALPQTLTAFREVTKKGRRVMAFGNPLDSTQVATFGEISGKYVSANSEVLVQTSAPINPGNSGGPLIDVQSGLVIAMNTSKLVDADNTGFAIPASDLLRAYRAWRKDPALSIARSIKARYRYWPVEYLENEGLLERVEKEIPRFSRDYENVLMVGDADKSTGLRAGDLILKVSGKVVGDNGHKFDELLIHAKDSVELRILRGGKVQDLQVPLVASGLTKLRRQVDFVYLEGLVLQDAEPQKAWGLHDGASRVTVAQVVSFTAAQESPLVQGSFIFRIDVGGRAFNVTTLNDLKRALNHHKADTPVRLYFRSPIVIGEGSAIYDEQIGGAVLSPGLQVAFLPVSEIYTPRELRLRLAKGGFDFGQTSPATRNWRHWVGLKAECREMLAGR